MAGTPSISATSGSTPRSTYEDSIDESKTLVFTGRGNLYQWTFDNNDNNDRFIQFYDAASTGAVTLGVTPIKHEFRVKASASTGLDAGGGNPLDYFTFGCVVAVVDARGGTGSPVTAASGNFYFQNRL